MKFDEFLKSKIINPQDESLIKRVNSNQFKLARKLLELEGQSKLDQQQVADYLGIDLGELLDFERGDSRLEISKYKWILSKLEELCYEKRSNLKPIYINLKESKDRFSLDIKKNEIITLSVDNNLSIFHNWLDSDIGDINKNEDKFVELNISHKKNNRTAPIDSYEKLFVDEEVLSYV